MLLSAAFGLLVWRLRAATPPAAVMGAAICLLLAQAPAQPQTPSGAPALLSPALTSLVLLFALTFAATRYGRAAKERRGLAEGKRGRRANQVLANLGVAALFAAAGHLVGALAALAEAAADTVSSEIGQAVGGPTWLLTTGRSVPAGTDGGVSLRGTLAGAAVAFAIALVAALQLHRPLLALTVFVTGCFGLLVDSALGATIERRGWIGNDLVNLLSTAAAALLACLL